MNKQKFYRVESNTIKWSTGSITIGCGPYTFLKLLKNITFVDNKDKEEWDKLRHLLARNEPFSTNPKKARLAKIGLFSTFKDKRPGPREDPYLRGKMPIKKKLLDNPYIYGFDSISQLNAWFDDKEEREQLHKLGFGISVYYSKEVLPGLRQAVTHENNLICKLESINL